MIPDLAWSMPLDLIQKVSKKHNVNKTWVAALVWQESRGDHTAVRYESHYKYLWFPRVWAERMNVTVQTEEVLQKTSYGLAQIMGSTARELGYDGPLSELARNAELALDYSVMYLKIKLEKYGTYRLAIAAYNAGSVRQKKGGMLVNEYYIDQVSKYYRLLIAINK